MLEDYIVIIGLPINDTPVMGGSPGHVFGSTFGFNAHETPGEPIWYWDGQDIWLPSTNTALLAMCKGTLKFTASGQDLGIGPESPPPGETPFPAIGDSLVLQIWPQDYIKLQELLPKGAQIPKYIVYQNVDRTSVVRRALSLIVDHTEYRNHYKKIFTSDEDGGEITDSEFRTRAQRWINDEWLHGRGIGVLVNSGDSLGEAAIKPTPPPGLPMDVRVDHYVAAEADEATWRRLTLKIVTSTGLHFAFPFFLYFVKNVENSDWTTRPLRSSFIDQVVSLVETLPLMKVTHQLRSSWTYDDPPEADMPKALPETVIEVKALNLTRKIVTLNDPFHTSEGFWRILSELPENPEGYQWQLNHSPLYAQRIPPPNRRDEVIDAITSADPGLIGLINPHWFTFDEYGNLSNAPSAHGKFILGINMPTCRRKSGWDMAANFFKPPSRGAWLDRPPDSTGGLRNYQKIEHDLDNIAAMGFSTVRIWVFEQMEGLDFEFETEYGRAISRASSSGTGGSYPLKEVQYDGDNYYVCSKTEFETLTSSWTLEVKGGTNHPRIDQLLRNAARIQQAAVNRGLYILWTLWAHYGENILGLKVSHWNNFFQVANEQHGRPISSYTGRLPLNAWIYRSIMTDRNMFQSYLDRAVIPFVNRMESIGGGMVLGYEIMNEINLHWSGSRLSHSIALGGLVPSDRSPGDTLWIGQRDSERNWMENPTGWTLSQTEIQNFVRTCAQRINAVARNKIIFSGVHNSNLSGHEMNLLYHPLRGTLRVDLSATGITYYTTAQGWGGLPDINNGYSYLRRHGDKCLFVEASEIPRSGVGYDCNRQVGLVDEILANCFSKGYSAVFLWHYDDPERGGNKNTYRNQHAFTEFSPLPPSPHQHPSTVSFTGAAPRLACQTVKEFNRINRPLILQPNTP